MSVGRKQNATNESWVAALAAARERCDRGRAEALVERAAEYVRQELPSLGSSAAFAWSGGKDSIALARVARAAGIDRCFLVASHLEYPSFEDWLTRHSPPGLDVLRIPLDLAWLRSHPDLLLPYTYRQQQEWFRLMQWNGQRKWCTEHGIDVLVMGRRKIDGNYVGKGCINRTKHGFVKWSPLCDWSHEDVLDVIVGYDEELPPVYDYPRGWRVATGPWAKRRCLQLDDVEEAKRQCWHEVWTADADVVREAATMLDQARSFMDREGLT